MLHGYSGTKYGFSFAFFFIWYIIPSPLLLNEGLMLKRWVCYVFFDTIRSLSIFLNLVTMLGKFYLFYGAISRCCTIIFRIFGAIILALIFVQLFQLQTERPMDDQWLINLLHHTSSSSFVSWWYILLNILFPEIIFMLHYIK